MTWADRFHYLWFVPVTVLLLLVPSKRDTARLALAETLVTWTLWLMPAGPQQREFAIFVVSCQWFKDVREGRL